MSFLSRPKPFEPILPNRTTSVLHALSRDVLGFTSGDDESESAASSFEVKGDEFFTEIIDGNPFGNLSIIIDKYFQAASPNFLETS